MSMLSRMVNHEGIPYERVRAYFSIDPKSNPIHVQDVFKLIETSVSHLSDDEGCYHTFNLEKGMNELHISLIPENKVEEAKALMEATLLVLEKQNIIFSYEV